MVVTLALRSEGTCMVDLGDVFKPLLDRDTQKKKTALIASILPTFVFSRATGPRAVVVGRGRKRQHQHQLQRRDRHGGFEMTYC